MDWYDFALYIYENRNKIPESRKYDYVMVDEAQDLSQMQLKILKLIAKKGILIAADKGQKIYKTYFSWNEIGINIKGGRTKSLRSSFRSTKEIMVLAQSLQFYDASLINDEEYIVPVLPNFNGPKPDLIKVSNESDQMMVLLANVEKLVQEYPQKTIGILTKDWKEAEEIEEFLKQREIDYEKLQKKEGVLTIPGVKLTTYHSAKGLEFNMVLLPNLVERKQVLDLEEKMVERRLLFVAITRAKEYVQMYTYGIPSDLLSEMDNELYRANNLTR